MKVLKFGGTSVGSVESILNLKSIVEACDEPVIVVVSTLDGITDKLIATGKMDASGESAYLPSLDAEFEKMRQAVEANGEHLRFVAKLENGKGSVSLQRVGVQHPFYNLEGSNNIVLLQTARYKQHPMQIQGYGAGAGVTAAGVFADIMSIANV